MMDVICWRRLASLLLLLPCVLLIGCMAVNGNETQSTSPNESDAEQDAAFAEMNLSDIPSISAVVETEGAASLSTSKVAAVKDVPTIGELAETTGISLTPNARSLVKTTFWKDGSSNVIDTLLTDYAPAGSVNVPNSLKEIFWGQKQGKAAGMGACRAIYSLGEDIGTIASYSDTTCYMKNMAKLKLGGAATHVSGKTQLSQIFSTAATAKLVKVNLTGYNISVFIKIPSIQALRNNTYKADVYNCWNGTPYNAESYRVDLKSREYISTGIRDAGPGETSSFSMVARLKYSRGRGFVFSGDYDKNIDSAWESSGQSFKSRMTISKESVETLRRWTDASDYFLEYSNSKTSGDSVMGLRVLEGAFAGLSSYSGNTVSTNIGFKGESGSYKVKDSGQYQKLAAKNGPNGTKPDGFFAGSPTAVASVPVDMSSYDCDAEPTDEFEYDVSHAEGLAIDETCRQELFLGYEMCSFDDLSNATDIVTADPDPGS